LAFFGSPPGLRIIVVLASRLPKMLWLNQAGEMPAPQTRRRALFLVPALRMEHGVGDTASQGSRCETTLGQAKAYS